MPKIKDEDLQQFFDEINTGPGKVKIPEPAFQRYRKHFLRDFDWNAIKKYSPERIIQAARTQEELIIIGEFLEREWGRDHWWWKLYHNKRIELGYLPSLYGIEKPGTPEMRGVWGVPVKPEEYLRYKNLAGPQAIAVERRLFPKLGTWEHLTGQKQLFNVVQTGNGPELRNWTALKTPTLKSNIAKNALIFDIEATGLLGQQSTSILSFGLHNTEQATSTAWYAPYDTSRKYSEAIETTILPQYRKAIQGKTLVSEQQIIENAIQAFEGAKDKAIMGYNIKSYDIPLLYERAKVYGLQNRLRTAILSNKSNIVDVAEYAQSFLSSKLGGKFLGWQQGELGTKPLGWQLGIVAQSLGYKSSGLEHEALEDVKMTKFVWEKLQNPLTAAKQFDINIYKQAVEKQTGKRLLEFTSGMGRVNFSAQMLKTEQEYLRSFTSHIESLYGKQAAKVAEIIPEKNIIAKLASTKIGKQTIGELARYGTVFTATNIILPGGFARNAISSLAFEAARYGAKRYGAGNIKQLVAGLGASALFNIGWGAFSNNEPLGFSERFSGADDYFNTIKGFQEGGMAADQRHQLTDFGSGFIGGLKGFGLKRHIIKDLLEETGYSVGKELPDIFSHPIEIPALNKAFKKLASSYHPDKGGTTEAFQELSTVYSLLKSSKNISSDLLGTNPFGAVSVSKSWDINTPFSDIIEEMKKAQSNFKSVGDNFKNINFNRINEILENFKNIEQRLNEQDVILKNIDFSVKTTKSNIDKELEKLWPNIFKRSAIASSILLTSYVAYNRFSAQDKYNEIEGLHPKGSGLGAKNIKENSDFGSGWDPLKAMAKSIFKDVGEKEAVSKLYKSEFFKSGIREALQGEGKKLGSGLTADAFEYVAKIKHGIESISEELPFVVKQMSSERMKAPGTRFNTVWAEGELSKYSQREVSALSALGDINTPSLYGKGSEFGLSDNAILMEKLVGKEINPSEMSYQDVKQLYKSVTEAHSRGIRHTDLHSGNIMRVKTGEEEKLAILDYGMSNRIIGSSIWKGRESAIQTAAQEVFGRNISAQEFEEAIDIGNVYSYLGSNTKQESSRLKSYFRTLLTSQSDTQLITETENLLQTTIKAKNIFGDEATRLPRFDIKKAFPEEVNPFSETEIYKTMPIEAYDKTIPMAVNGQSFSGKDDAYNTIEGLKHGGLAQTIRQEFTDFGSGWDPVRALAKSIYKDSSKKEAFNLLRKSDEWVSMLRNAKQIKELSYGSFGTTHLMEGEFRGETIKFIKKTPRSKLSEEFAEFIPGLPTQEQRTTALRQEYNTMQAMENRISPNVYGYGKDSDELYMELMPGKTIHELIQEGHKIDLDKVKRTINKEMKAASKKGIRNTDIHTGNIMLDPETDKISWIDWGLGKSSPNTTADWSAQNYKDMAEVAEEKLFTPISQSSSARKSANIKQESFFSDWGDLNSSSASSNANSKTIPKTIPNSLIYGKTIPLPTSDIKQSLKRMNNFNKVSTEAVGIGFRSANGAGKKHRGFSSIKSA